MTSSTPQPARSPQKQHTLNEMLASAAYDGRDDGVLLALERGADPKYSHSEALYWAAQNGCMKALEILAPVSDNFFTAIQNACYQDQQEATKFLIPFYVNSHPKTEEMNSLFRAIVRVNDMEAARLMLCSTNLDINMDNGYPLIDAAQRNHVEMVQFLLEQGADPSLSYGRALLFAASNGGIEVVRLLMPLMDEVTVNGVAARLEEYNTSPEDQRLFLAVHQSLVLQRAVEGETLTSAGKLRKM